MGLTVTVGSSQYVSGYGNLTISHTVAADENYLLVMVAHGWQDSQPTAVTFNGKALTKDFEISHFSPKTIVQAWRLYGDDGLDTGTHDVVVTRPGGWETLVTVYSGKADGVPSITDSGGDGGAAGGHTATVDGGGYASRAFIACTTGGTASPPATSNMTVDYSANTHGTAHETASDTGSRTVGWNEAYAGWGYVLLTAGDIEIAGAHSGMTVGLRAGTVALSGDVTIGGARLRGLTVGLRAGAVAFTAKRQVALVGGGIETAEMTVDGDEGDLFTQHATRNPTWESPDSHTHTKRWAPVTTDPDGDGVHELLFTDGGDVVLMEVQD